MPIQPVDRTAATRANPPKLKGGMIVVNPRDDGAGEFTLAGNASTPILTMALEAAGKKDRREPQHPATIGMVRIRYVSLSSSL